MLTIYLRVISVAGLAIGVGCQAPISVDRYSHPLGGRPLNTIVVQTDPVFQTGRFRFTDEGKTQIQELAEQTRRYWPGRRIVIFGHTDSSPITKTPRFNNYEKTQHRADAVKAVFVAAGFALKDVSAFGMGPDFPIATNATVQGMRANRRVEIVVIQKE